MAKQVQVQVRPQAKPRPEPRQAYYDPAIRAARRATKKPAR